MASPKTDESDTPNSKRSVAFSPSVPGAGPRQRGNGELSPRVNLRCFGSGLNFFYQLNGDDKSKQRYEVPTRMEWLESLRPSTLACGGHFTYAISERDGGAVYRWGTDNGIVYQVPEIIKYPDHATSSTTLSTPPTSSSPTTPSSSMPSSSSLLSTSPSTTISMRPRALALACGSKHTLILVEGGYVYGIGVGYFGQLGCGDDASSHVPKPIKSLSPESLVDGDRVFSISAGGAHSGAITKKGDIFMWGFNRSSQCGVVLKGSSTISVPTLITGLSEVKEGGIPIQLVCGRHHSTVLTDTGAVFSWGATSFGRLGIHDLSSKKSSMPKRVTTLDHFAVHTLAAGDFHMLALTRDRRVFSWGYGGEGQCGHGGGLHLRTPRPIEALKHVLVSKIACSGWYSSCLSADGYLYTWGYGDGGWLGVEKPSNPPLGIVDDGPGGTSQGKSNASGSGSGSGGVHNKSGVDEDICSFDSAHNELVPTMVTALKEYQVTQVFCGDSHMISLSIARPDHATLPISPRKRIAPPPGRPPEPATVQHSSRPPSSHASTAHHHQTPPPRHKPTHKPTHPQPTHYDSTPPPSQQQSYTSPHYETVDALNYGEDVGGGGGDYQQQEWYGDESYYDASNGQQQYYDNTYNDSSANNTPVTGVSNNGGGGVGFGVGAVDEVYDPYATTLEGGKAAQDEDEDVGDEEEDEALKLRKLVFSAQRHGRFDEVQKAIDGGFDVSQKDDNGNSLLSIAAQNGLKGGVKLCLRNKADINAKNRTGNTALHYCFKYGHSGLGAYLIKKGADDTILNNAGLTVYEGI